MGRVSGKIAMVTGAASGLGKADALALASEGASVILTDIDDTGQQAADEIQLETGQKALFIHHDVSNEAQWQAVMETVEAEFGGLDVLVNNAGIAIVASPEDTTLEQFRRSSAVMSEGVFLGCKAAIPLMRKRGGGSIINMASVATHLGYPVYFAYSAAKGAVRAMTKVLAIHCQMNGYNIRCNSVHPGAIDTPMLAQSFIDMGLEPPDPDSENPALPVGVGKPEDVASVVVFLASDESRLINGAELMLDNALSVQ